MAKKMKRTTRSIYLLLKLLALCCLSLVHELKVLDGGEENVVEILCVGESLA